MTALERDISACLDGGDLRGAATHALRGYGPELRRFVERALHSSDAAAELMAQVGEELWRALPAFRRECSVRTWAYRITWHAVLRQRRRRSGRVVRRLNTSEWSRLAAEVPSSSRGSEGRRARLAQLHAQLAPEELALLHLRVDLELPWEEVADVLSAGGGLVTPVALRKRFERLKQRIAVLARREGLLERR